MGANEYPNACNNVLCKILASTARDVPETARAGYKVHGYEWSHPKSLLEIEAWVRGSPLCVFSTAKDGLSKVEVIMRSL
jgi:hypothetical protein